MNRMKGMVMAFITILLCVSISVTASASEKEAIDEAGQSVQISVKAVFKESDNPNIFKTSAGGGSPSITTRNGTTVLVTHSEAALESGARLVVREITKEETLAYGWFTGVLKEIGTGVLPYDIFFEKDGQRILLNAKIQISITLPEGYQSPLVCHVTTGGKVVPLLSKVKNGAISFESDHTGYYVIAERIKVPGSLPQTGPGTNLLLYAAIMLFAASILMYIISRPANRSQEVKSTKSA